MSRLVTVVVALALSSMGWAAQPPARDTSGATTGSGSIRGRVTDMTGHPLPRVEVRAGPNAGQVDGRIVLTDGEGRYEIANLPAGTYTIIAAKANYVRTSWGEQRPEGPGKRIPLADGQALANVDVRLQHTGAITGKIVDEFGDPVTGVTVQGLRYQYVQGTRRLMPSGRGGATNDIGEFRIFGLTPGQYYVSATLRNFGAMNADTTDRSGYAPTFFPGTGNQAEAQRMAVAPGQTITSINMTLLPIQTATVSGTVLDLDGRLLANGMIRVGSKTPIGGAGFFGSTLRDGKFTVNGLTPGEYIITVMRPGGADSATADVTVSGSDISGIQIQIAPPSTIRGRIAFTPSANGSDPPKPTAYDLGAVREWALGQQVRFPAKIKDDGTFEISLQASHVQLRAAPVGGGNGPNGPPPWRIGRVLFAGTDVGDTGLDVAANGAVEDVVVEMTNKSSEVTGAVTDADGKVVRDVFVIAFAQDPARWTVQTRWLSVARPGLDDKFHARLLAGDYYVVAMTDVENGAWTDPDFLAAAREHATKLSVGDRETKTIDLTVSPTPVY